MPIRLIKHDARYTIRIEQVVFEVKRLAPDLEAALFDQLGQTEKKQERVTIAIDLLERALVGWEGLTAEDGQPVPFAKERIRELPWLVLINLALQVALGGHQVDPPQPATLTP